MPPPPKEATVHLMPTYAGRKATAVWHTDSTLAGEPAGLLALRAVELLPGGGDTCWGSMIAAYDTLFVSVQMLIDALSAEHSAYKIPLPARPSSASTASSTSRTPMSSSIRSRRSRVYTIISACP
jgi:alpha-ketoglutarate-dependent taurine dioxygenase